MSTYKCIYLVKRNPALTAEAFPARWRQHAKLAAKTRLNNYFTGVVQCSLSHDADFPVDATRDYDGANLLYMRDLAATTDIWLEPEQGEVLAPDELLTFSRLIRECMINTQEHVTRDGAFTECLLLRFLRRASGLETDQFLASWGKTHGRAELEGASGELVRRSVSNEVIATPPPDFQFDLITELWFDDIEAARRYDCDHELQSRLAAERGRLCAPEGVTTFMAKVTHAYRAPAVA